MAHQTMAERVPGKGPAAGANGPTIRSSTGATAGAGELAGAGAGGGRGLVSATVRSAG